MTPEQELALSLQAAAAGDAEGAQHHWNEFVRLLFGKMLADGGKVIWRK